MRLSRAKLAGVLLLCADPAAAGAAASEPQPPDARIEAQSADFFAVGTVHGARMTIHLSRTSDNAPVRDATVNLVLRGAAHPATAESDGSYSVETPDLALPGAAAVQLQITRAGIHEDLDGTLQIAQAPGKPEETNTPRQILWWVLNFAVCVGFLMLWRRRKSAATKEPE